MPSLGLAISYRTFNVLVFMKPAPIADAIQDPLCQMAHRISNLHFTLFFILSLEFHQESTLQSCLNLSRPIGTVTLPQGKVSVKQPA